MYHVNHFKASQDEQQQILGRNTLPVALNEVYGICTKSPDLNVFNCYRDDGKSGLAFYTDPDYFYNLWAKGEQERIAEKKRNRAVRERVTRFVCYYNWCVDLKLNPIAKW